MNEKTLDEKVLNANSWIRSQKSLRELDEINNIYVELMDFVSFRSFGLTENKMKAFWELMDISIKYSNISRAVYMSFKEYVNHVDGVLTSQIVITNFNNLILVLKNIKINCSVLGIKDDNMVLQKMGEQLSSYNDLVDDLSVNMFRSYFELEKYRKKKEPKATVNRTYTGC